MLDSLPAAITAISSSLTILKAAVGVRDENKMLLALNDVYADVMNAQMQAVGALSQLTAKDVKIRELEEQIKRMQDWSAEKDKWKIFPMATGVFAYIPVVYKDKLRDAIKLCVNCFDNHSRKSTLQVVNKWSQIEGSHYLLTCPNRCPDIKFNAYCDDV